MQSSPSSAACNTGNLDVLTSEMRQRVNGAECMLNHARNVLSTDLKTVGDRLLTTVLFRQVTHGGCTAVAVVTRLILNETQHSSITHCAANLNAFKT